MQQKPPAFLDYRTPRRRSRLRAFGGCSAGWMVGTAASGMGIARLLGGTGIVVPIVCVGTLLAGLPGVGVNCWSGRLSRGPAFLIAAVASTAVAFGILVAMVLSYHGC